MSPDTVEFVLHGLDVVNLVVAALSIGLLLKIMSRYGQSDISTIFGYFIIGTISLASARLFILYGGVSGLSDDTVTFGWHLLFYLAMVLFFIAGKGMARLSTTNIEDSHFNSKMLNWSIASVILILVIFIGMTVIDQPFTTLFNDTLIDRLGVIHFLAFLIAGIAAFYLFKRAKLGSITTLLAVPYLCAFGMFALNHVWELLNESWQITHVADPYGELVEQIFVVPGFLLILFAYYRLDRLLRGSSSSK